MTVTACQSSAVGCKCKATQYLTVTQQSSLTHKMNAPTSCIHVANDSSTRVVGRCVTAYANLNSYQLVKCMSSHIHAYYNRHIFCPQSEKGCGSLLRTYTMKGVLRSVPGHPDVLSVSGQHDLGQHTLQCLGHMMTTSSSLPHNPTDNKMGMGLRFRTATFPRFFNLGRWEAMTSPASACE